MRALAFCAPANVMRIPINRNEMNHVWAAGSAKKKKTFTETIFPAGTILMCIHEPPHPFQLLSTRPKPRPTSHPFNRRFRERRNSVTSVNRMCHSPNEKNEGGGAARGEKGRSQISDSVSPNTKFNMPCQSSPRCHC